MTPSHHIEASLLERAKKIKLLLLDVDGVLTPGQLYFLVAMQEIYVFNVYDGYAMKLWKRAGFKSGFITGRGSEAVEARASKLGVDFLHMSVADKVAVCEEIIHREGLEWSEVAFVGDDLQDLSVLRKVGFAASVANGREEVKKQVHYVSLFKGGEGAVRDIVEFLLKAKGKWDEVLAQDRILS